MSGFLLALSLGPIQEFIAAARRTADLWAGSHLLVTVVEAAARALEQEGAALIFPAAPDQAGANKILAEVSGTASPAALAERAQAAARDALREAWQEASGRLNPRQRDLLDADLAERQMEKFLEFYAAWWPLGDDYPAARRNVEQLLAGRKALRDFAPLDQNDAGRAKSLHDPAFAGIFRDWDAALEGGPLRMRRTENLDGISLVKRVRGAAALGGVIPHTRTLARRATETGASNEPEGQEQEPDFPYFAILAADGDHMGVIIAKRESPEDHREFSRLLAAFAGEAAAVVAKHDGLTVYCGGDDVLAFLPVTKAIEAASALAKAFAQRTGGTLSAGVAIVHYREPLSQSLANARAAERAAKDAGRDRLTLALHTRGGGGAPLRVTKCWETLDWEVWTAAFREERITRGVAYELRELARAWPEGVPPERLRAEAERILKRKEAKEAKDVMLPPFDTADALSRFADTLVAARFLTGREL